MNRAVFFLSSGRCGTQWLARNLAATYPDWATVEHEPLHDGYRSRELLACPDLSAAGSAATIGGHVSEIEAVLRTSMYIECGWPSWAALPYLTKHFAGRVAIVHLTRHPIPTACSWVTHRMYQPPVIPDLHPEKVPLSPFDAGVTLPEYRRIWDSLDPFQRCLYFWTEVHRFGLELEAKVGAAWLRLRYEDMLSPDGLMTLLEFLDLPPRHAVFDAVATPDDQYRHVADRWWDVTSALHLPRLAETATLLGYDVAEVDETALRRRYLGA